MPTTINRDAQLSTLANLAYSDKPPTTVGDWTLVRPSEASSTGFSAVAYINNTTKEVVISYRGTDGLKGDIGADIAFKTGSWNPQFQEAAKFTAQVKELVANDSQYWDPNTQKPGALLTTGHSLGGGIAQIMGKMFGADGASFDAPGASAIVNSAGYAAAQAQYASDSSGQIGTQFYNYVAQGSVISSVGKHLGQDQSLVNLSDPSAAPLLVGVVGAMTGGAALGLLGLAASSNVLSTHPMAGIERAMYIAAGLDQALKDGSLTMSTVPLSQATGSVWQGEGVEPRVVVFKNGDGHIKAYVQRDGNNWIAATPDQSTIIRLNKPAGSDAPVCTVQQEGKDSYSCTLSQSGKAVSISKDTNGDGGADEISVTQTTDDLLSQTTRLTDADGDLLQTTTTDYTYSANSADYQTSSTVTDADGKVTRSVHTEVS